MSQHTLVRVIDVYDRHHLVSRDDLNSRRIQIPLRFQDGRKFSDSDRLLCSGKPLSIHRDNIKSTEAQL